MTSLREEGIRLLAQHLRNCRCLTNDPHALLTLNDCIHDLLKHADEIHQDHTDTSEEHNEQH